MSDDLIVSDIDGINNHVMRVAKTQVKAEQDLRCLVLFEDQKNHKGAVVRRKSQRNSKTTPMNQILLEERDCYERAAHQFNKYAQSYDRMADNDEIDGGTLIMVMGFLSKAELAKTKHLENMGKNVMEQTREVNKGSVAMQKTITDVNNAKMKMKAHEDKMELKWADVEKITGKSREEILKELYGED